MTFIAALIGSVPLLFGLITGWPIWVALFIIMRTTAVMMTVLLSEFSWWVWSFWAQPCPPIYQVSYFHEPKISVGHNQIIAACLKWSSASWFLHFCRNLFRWKFSFGFILLHNSYLISCGTTFPLLFPRRGEGKIHQGYHGIDSVQYKYYYYNMNTEQFNINTEQDDTMKILQDSVQYKY